MKKFTKIRYFLLGIAILYIIVCAICNFSYSYFLRALVPAENLLFTESLTTYNKDDDIFVIYSVDEKIVFRRITNTYIAPFYWVKIPKLESEYIYNVIDPESSTHVEGSQEFNVVDFLNNGSLIAKTYAINDPGNENAPGYSPFFFGFCTEDFFVSGVSEYRFQYIVNGGYIFAFYGQDNKNFNEDSFMIAY